MQEETDRQARLQTGTNDEALDSVDIVEQPVSSGAIEDRRDEWHRSEQESTHQLCQTAPGLAHWYHP